MRGEEGEEEEEERGERKGGRERERQEGGKFTILRLDRGREVGSYPETQQLAVAFLRNCT